MRLNCGQLIIIQAPHTHGSVCDLNHAYKSGHTHRSIPEKRERKIIFCASTVGNCAVLYVYVYVCVDALREPAIV